MRKLIAITQVSLDGVMQGPGGPEEDPGNGFSSWGWAMPFLDGAGGKVVTDIMSKDFDLLLGRKTYDIWKNYWPLHEDNPIGAAFKKAVKHVVTRGLGPLPWARSERISDAIEGVRKLKASSGHELHLWGSSNLLQTLIAAELIDEHQLWVIPVVLGQGKRLFENGVPPRAFKLISSASSPSGVLYNSYQPAGPIPKA